MNTDKATEKKNVKPLAVPYCFALCGVSGFMVGSAFNNVQLGLGISLGLFAIVSAIFFGQDNQ